MMKTQSRTLIALSALGFAAGSALAQTSPKQPQPAPAPSALPSAPPSSAPGGASGSGMKYTFETLDKDNDGVISKAEAALVPALNASFNTLDKNRDGKVDRKEFDGVTIVK